MALKYYDFRNLLGWNCTFFDLKFSKTPDKILGKREMPGAEWFPGATLNYADQMLSRAERSGERIVFVS